MGAANPRRTFLAVAVASALVLVVSLPSAFALQGHGAPELANSKLAGATFPGSQPAQGSPKESTAASSSSPGTSSSSPGTSSSSPGTSSSSPGTSSDAPSDQQKQAPEADVRQAVEDYYEAVARGAWDYTYDNLDSQARRMFTREEWGLKNQYFANNGSLKLSSFDVTGIDPSGSEASVSLGAPFSRVTYFVYEGGSWKHRLSEEEINLFMPGVPFEDFVKAQEGDSTDDEASSGPSAPAKRTVTSSVKPNSTVTTSPSSSSPARSAPSPTPTPYVPSTPPQPTKSSGANCSSGAHNIPVAPGSKGDRDGDGTACEK